MIRGCVRHSWAVGVDNPRLREHVRAARGALPSAVLTVLRGWVAAGRPAHGLTPWGSDEGWSGIVRGAVVFTGLPDPGDTRLALQTAADRDAAAMAVVLDGLARADDAGRGLTAADLIVRVRAAGPGPEWAGDTRVVEGC